MIVRITFIICTKTRSRLYFLGSFGSRHSAGREVLGHGWSVLCFVRRRSFQPRASVRSVQHGKTVEPTLRVRVREQRVRNGNEFRTVSVKHIVLHEGRLHTRHLGENTVYDLSELSERKTLVIL